MSFLQFILKAILLYFTEESVYEIKKKLLSLQIIKEAPSVLLQPVYAPGSKL